MCGIDQTWSVVARPVAWFQTKKHYFKDNLNHMETISKIREAAEISVFLLIQFPVWLGLALWDPVLI